MPAILAADLLAQQVDALAVSGDLTRRAAPREFAAAFAFLAAIGRPVLVTPGNHDIPRLDLRGRFLDPRGRWRAGLPAAVAAEELRVAGVRVLALDTVSRAQWHLDWSAGAVGRGRRRRLAARLLEEPALVLCHHPLLHPPGFAGRPAPRGATAARALLAACGVPLVLSGHLHAAAALPLGPDGPWQIIAPSALSPRGGHPNGWVLVTREAGRWRARLRVWKGGSWQQSALLGVGAAPPAAALAAYQP